jgi:hypothetical protein
MALMNRLNMQSRAIVRLCGNTYRIDLTNLLGSIPDWVMWQLDDCQYCDLQTFALADAEVLKPEFTLSTWKAHADGYDQEFGTVILTGLTGSTLVLRSNQPHYTKPGMVLREKLNQSEVLDYIVELRQVNKKNAKEYYRRKK